MSYIIEQKIGKNIYLYEVESFWDAVKKQPRQKRRYIGKKDPSTGQIITPRKSLKAKFVRAYGNVYLLQNVADKIGLSPLLNQVFGKDLKELFLSLVFYELTEGKPFYLYPYWAEETHFVHYLTSQQIAELLKKISSMQEQMERFFSKWIVKHKEREVVVFDITSISSYSKNSEIVEWGYNRDRESIPQINFAIAFGIERGLPLLYRIYPGSIADVSTLRNMMSYLKEIGVKEFIFVLDRGFYSITNIREMNQSKIGFIIAMPFSVKLAQRLISESMRRILNPSSAFYFRKEAIFHTQREVKLGGTDLYAHIYLSERRKAEEIEELIKKIDYIETEIKRRRFESQKEGEEFIESIIRGGSKLFSVEWRKSTLVVKRRDREISRLIGRMGKMIILTNRAELDREEIILFYRRKDRVEKIFDAMKNDLNCSRLRVSSREAMEGRLFLSYLSLILWSAIINVMKEGGLYKTYTVAELLYELKKLKMVQMLDGKEYLTEVSKKQREIFNKFDISVPVKIET